MERGWKIFIGLGLAFTGAIIVMCFPFPVGEMKTCLLDHWLGGSAGSGMATADRVHRYVYPFGLIWWTALATAYVLARVLLMTSKRGRDANSISKNGNVFGSSEKD